MITTCTACHGTGLLKIPADEFHVCNVCVEKPKTEPKPQAEVNLFQTVDARDWAKEFMRLFGHRRELIDESLIHTWFANAIMTGCDHERWRIEEKLKSIVG